MTLHQYKKFVMEHHKKASSEPIRVTYFNLMGLGEPIRFLLACGGFEFIDDRIQDEGSFRTIQNSFPYRKVPILEIEGKTIHQSVAICRYLAKKVGLAGKSEWDALECDIMVDTLGDLRTALVAPHYEKLPELKQERLSHVVEQVVPFYLDRLERHLVENQGSFLKGQLSWPDVYFAAMSDYLDFLAARSLLEDHPALKALREKVLTIPNIREYVKSRPSTAF